jgi:hypothetical protein
MFAHPIAVGWRLGILRIIVAIVLYIFPFVGQTAAKAAHAQIIRHVIQIEVRNERLQIAGEGARPMFRLVATSQCAKLGRNIA